MAGNTFGQLFRLTTFGESHGSAIGGIIDGCPSGMELDINFINNELARRKPGQSSISSSRKEKDEITFLSGIFEGKTTGAPIAFLIPNQDQKSEDYDHLKNVYRPSHADYTYKAKYGHTDYRGGGRASARETVARVAGGAIAKIYLNKFKINIQAFVSQIGEIKINQEISKINFHKINNNILRCPDEKVAAAMIKYLDKIKKEGDTVGGIISCKISGCPVGLGEPVFDKLQADLAKAMLSIQAVKGFEYGSGFAAASLKGSEHNDEFVMKGNKIHTITNYSGGIQGGISNGEDIYFNVAFKPVPTIMQAQNTVDKKGKNVLLEAKGRHDVCVVPRAVPIVEAMAALVIADHCVKYQR
jgi:chorismate synthase